MIPAGERADEMAVSTAHLIALLEAIRAFAEMQGEKQTVELITGILEKLDT